MEFTPRHRRGLSHRAGPQCKQPISGAGSVHGQAPQGKEEEKNLLFGYKSGLPPEEAHPVVTLNLGGQSG